MTSSPTRGSTTPALPPTTSSVDDGNASLGRRAVPRVVFTDPLVAAVGQTETTARDAGFELETRQASMSQQAEASVWGEDVAGSAKLVIDASDATLLGATFTGPAPLAEMVFGAQVAIIGRVPVDTLRQIIPQFPTFSEVWLDLLDG
jgi:dihydrolipoamide dehydrogenase